MVRYTSDIETEVVVLKSKYGIDVSREIGHVLDSFASYWGSDEPAKELRVGELREIRLFRDEMIFRGVVIKGKSGSVEDYFLHTDEGDFPLMELEFLRTVEGLEDYLTYRLMSNMSLEDTMRSGAEICRVLRDKEEQELKHMHAYFEELKKRKPEGRGAAQLSPENIPEEWLNRRTKPLFPKTIPQSWLRHKISRQ